MTTTATHKAYDTTPERVLCMACALREKTWTLGCPIGHGQQPRERTVAARHPARVRQAIAQAKSRCGLPATAPGVRGDEAGRDGCWRQRFLQAQGMTHPVVDASAIAVNRRQRRATSDGVDVRTLLRMLMRYAPGDRAVWRVVPVPAVAAEDQRQLPRALATLQQARASPTPRIKGLRSRQGVKLTRLTPWPAPLDALRRWDGAPLPRGLHRRVLRVYAPHEFLRAQSAAVDAARRALLHPSQAAAIAPVRPLMPLRGLGSNGSWVLVRACFAWRDCKHRREVGG